MDKEEGEQLLLNSNKKEVSSNNNNSNILKNNINNNNQENPNGVNNNNMNNNNINNINNNNNNNNNQISTNHNHLISSSEINSNVVRVTKYSSKDPQNLESTFKLQKIKSLNAYKNQQRQQEQWFNEDKGYLNLKINLIDSLELFLSGDFEINENDNQLCINQIKEWSEIKVNNNNENNNNNKKDNSSQNIILKNKIFRLKNNYINLRSLSVFCEVSLLMSGESNFYIFSRCTEKFNSQTLCVCISKELESARKFISFAIIEEKDEDNIIIKNLKKQEIPRQENYIKTLDITEIKFIFVDNGDNKCFVFLDEQENQNSNLNLYGDFFEPITFNSNLMFAVSGDLISLKKLSIKQTLRNSYVSLRQINRNNNSVQSCNCCNIF